MLALTAWSRARPCGASVLREVGDAVPHGVVRMANLGPDAVK